MLRIAVVTGATGCVGRNLVDALLHDDWHVVALHRATSDVSRLAGLPIELRQCDLHSRNSTLAALPRRVHCLFHVAGNTSYWRLDAERQWRDNVLATRNLLYAARTKRARRFVYTSTGATRAYAQLGASDLGRLGLSGYVRTKRLAEIEVERAGLDAVVLRPGVVIGPYDWNSYSQIFSAIQDGMLRGLVLPGGTEFCHARDVARAHVNAADRGESGAAYTLGGPIATWLEVFQKIARLVGVAPPTRATPLWAVRVLAHGWEWMSYLTRRKPLLTPQLVALFDHSGATDWAEVKKAKADLGYGSASLDAMLLDCYRWLVGEGRLRAPI